MDGFYILHHHIYGKCSVMLSCVGVNNLLISFSESNSCLKFDRGTSKPRKLLEQYVLDYRPPTLSSDVQTKSGRKVKQRFNSNNIYQEMEIIQDFDYDDELDLLVVLHLNPTKTGQGIVGFYDNQTGQHLRNLNIDAMDEQDEHSIAINRNILVIISRRSYNFK